MSVVGRDNLSCGDRGCVLDFPDRCLLDTWATAPKPATKSVTKPVQEVEDNKNGCADVRHHDPDSFWPIAITRNSCDQSIGQQQYNDDSKAEVRAKWLNADMAGIACSVSSQMLAILAVNDTRKQLGKVARAIDKEHEVSRYDRA